MFCGYKMNEVITRERFAMARVRYILEDYIAYIAFNVYDLCCIYAATIW